MTRPLTPDMIEQINTREINPCLLVEAEFEGGTVNLWTGVGEIEWDGKTWMGGGSLLGISPVEESMRLGAKSLQFSLRGLDPSIISVALQDQYQWRPIRMWLGLLKWNLLDAPNDFTDGVWEKFRASITPNAIIAPDGTLSGAKLVEDTTPSDSHFMRQIIVTLASTTYTTSVYLKAGERTFARLNNGNFVGQIDPQTVNIDLSNGIVEAADNTRVGIEDAGNGWWRVHTTNTTTGVVSTVRPTVIVTNSFSGSINYDGDGTSGIYVWGAQTREQKQVLTFTPYQLFGGRMDVMGVGTDGTSAEVSVTAENSLISIRQNTPRFYTEADQKARYGGDRGLEFIARIEDSNIAWGKA